MTPERFEQIAQLYHAALELEPERRAEFLHNASGGDEELEREVKKLLAGNERAGSFLNQPAVAVAAEMWASEEIESPVGKRLGRFEILSLLGAGGMGQVYLAQDSQLGRRVALKLLPREFTEKPDRLRRFEREARAASALNHPNIITIHDIGEADGVHFIATEYIEGEMLRRRIARGRVPLDEALEIATQVAQALDIAHTAGIIHRDIKPENIMLRPDGYVKVLDFGLAKLTEPKMLQPEAGSQVDTQPLPEETSAGLIVGTVKYMSPEQARGMKVDGRSDLWSLGVTLYEMLVGKSPFGGPTATDVIVSIIDRQPPPLTQSFPDMPVEADHIVMKALAKDREDRYQTAREMAIDLKSLKQQLSLRTEEAPTLQLKVETPVPGTPSPSTSRLPDESLAPAKKSAISPMLLGIVILLIAVVGYGSWLFFRPKLPVEISSPVVERQISYSFIVQKMRNDKEVGEPFEVSEQAVFNSSDRFRLKVSSPQDGYLYLLSKDADESGGESYALLFPTPLLNKGSAQLPGNQPSETGRYGFDPNKKTQNLVLVWAAQPVSELEAVKGVVNDRDFGVIKNPDQLKAVKAFLQPGSTLRTEPGETPRQTRVRGSSDVFIHPITLTYN